MDEGFKAFVALNAPQYSSFSIQLQQRKQLLIYVSHPLLKHFFHQFHEGFKAPEQFLSDLDDWVRGHFESNTTQKGRVSIEQIHDRAGIL